MVGRLGSGIARRARHADVSRCNRSYVGVGVDGLCT